MKIKSKHAFVVRGSAKNAARSLGGAILSLALLSNGCAGYRLGPTNGLQAGEKSIQIVPFANQTLEPRLGEAVTSALRKQVQHDGTFHLNTSGDADIVVTGEVIHLTRHRLAFQPKDT